MDEKEREKVFVDHATQFSDSEDLPFEESIEKETRVTPECTGHSQLIDKLEKINFSLSVLIGIVFIAALFHVLALTKMDFAGISFY